jgi:hypothetical protein
LKNGRSLDLNYYLNAYFFSDIFPEKEEHFRAEFIFIYGSSNFDP